MDEMKIDTLLLGMIADEIKRIGLQMDESMSVIKLNMDDTQNVWNGKTPQILQDKYKNLDCEMDDFMKTLTSYAKFLSDTANEYGYAEKKIEGNALLFK